MPKGYVIAQISVSDPETYADYVVRRGEKTTNVRIYQCADYR